MQMRVITSFFAAAPAVWSVKVVPLVLTILAWALAVVTSVIAQPYVPDEVNAAAPLSVTVLGPFVFGMTNVPVTACCAV